MPINNRYPWIPRKRKRRIPAFRPVTILDDIPANTRQGWYRTEWAGVPLQVFTQPSLTPLGAGQLIMARHIPTAGELFFPSPETIRPPELWFTDGADNSARYPARIWRYQQGAAAPEFVAYVDSPELVTMIFWSKVFNCVFICTTTLDNDWGAAYDAIYQVTQHPTSPSITKIWQSPVFYWGDPAASPNDALIDVAEFENQLFFMSNTAGDNGKVLVFNPNTATMTEDLNFTAFVVGACGTYGINGGIATDAGNGRLFASDGSVIAERLGPGSYAVDLIVNGDPGGMGWGNDAYSMVTDWDNDIIFHGVNGYSSPDNLQWQTVIERDNPTNAFSLLMDEPGFSGVGAVTFCNLFNHSTGALIATFGGHYAGGESLLISKTSGGLWQRDGQFAGYVWDANERCAEYCFATQSMAPMGSHLYILTRHLHSRNTGGVWVNDPDAAALKLWRRDGNNSYALIWTSEPNRWTFYFNYDMAGICAAPPPLATPAELALMRRAHEVN